MMGAATMQGEPQAKHGPARQRPGTGPPEGEHQGHQGPAEPVRRGRWTSGPIRGRAARTPSRPAQPAKYVFDTGPATWPARKGSSAIQASQLHSAGGNDVPAGESRKPSPRERCEWRRHRDLRQAEPPLLFRRGKEVMSDPCISARGRKSTIYTLARTRDRRRQDGKTISPGDGPQIGRA